MSLTDAQIEQRKAASRSAAILRDIKSNPRSGKSGRPKKAINATLLRKLVDAGASVTQVQEALNLSRGVAQRAVQSLAAGAQE